ncbi:MAG TPA: amino acid adenylation domain-containing protein [Steroidobacteraceae bacterium]|nr:amino acid adenylation domain-containing protein [Steroidobacteraceae bacterium]
MTAEARELPPGAIAIVGMSGRFPGAASIEQFWRNLCAGVESITRFSDAELEDSFDEEVRRAPNYVKARPILTDVDQFDAEFFGMYAREAELTDPQHRLFLECAWEALESAGYDPAAYSGLIGVFGGCSINTYFLRHVCTDRAMIERFTSSYQVGSYPELLGAGLEFLATRVSYKLDLKGPSMTVESACSTSLLAVAQACQSLLLYQSDMALAGGISISFPQQRGYLHQEGGMVSADGSCRTFDASASGTIFGSGGGVVLLKRLEDAVADGDHIYAVIRGIGVNNDGAAKVGYTAPSVDGQAAAIEMAHANAGINARSIDYVECHGTATPLGDPIEVAALTKAFRAGTADRQFCALGSVKTNIGHLDAGAGVTGLIKTALSLERELLPAALHFERPNPQIDFPASPFFVGSKLTPWARASEPRRAGVSAFGVGGTNVHLVLEEAPALSAADAQEASAPGSQVLVLSARTETAVMRMRAALAAHLREQPHLSLADAAYTLQRGRRAFEKRAFIVCRDAADAIAQLEAPADASHSGRAAGKAPVAFMFPGQGSQYPGMARDLYRSEPEFRRSVDRCVAICRRLTNEDLLALIHPEEPSPAAADRLKATSAAQPALFTIEYSLAQLWISRGIRPQAMIGHSIGEFVAAAIGGTFSLEDALELVVMRGRLMQSLPGGAMLSVRLPEKEVLPLLTADLALAAVNGPSLCVVSGPEEAVAGAEAALRARGAMSRRLHTSHAFHSRMIDPIVAPLRQRLAQLRLSAPTLRWVSCVSGRWIADEEATSPEYWARHARETVRFADGVAALAAQNPPPLLLEVGPGNVLSTLALQTLQGGGKVVTSLQGAEHERDDRDCLLEAAGRLWAHGAEPDWQAWHSGPRRRIPLPTYSFDRKRHWVDAPPRAASSASSAARDVVADSLAHSLAHSPAATPAAAATNAPAVVELSQDVNAVNQNQNPNSTRIPELTSAILTILEELSGEKPKADNAAATFLEMGYDSLFLTQVAQKIQSQTKVKITFRQLLGQYSTVASLAGFLAEKLPPSAPQAAAAPAPAAQQAARAAAVAPASVSLAASATALSGALPAASSAAGLDALFRDQLQAMTQLVNRQMEVLQNLGLAAPGGAGTPAAPVATAARVGAQPAPVAATISAPSSPAQASSSAAPAPSAPEAPAPEAPSRFQVYNPKKAGAATLSAAHRSHIDDLARRYGQRTAGSKRFTQAHRPVLADPRAASGFRTDWKELVYPVVCARSSGSKIWDLDGNEYIDLVNGYGQTFFGHAPDFVVAAVKEQLDQGFAIGPQTELAGKVSALFAKLTGNERVTFCNTGSEAVMAAMRVARTVTGRSKVVIFNGDYHGQFDEVLVKGVQKAGAPPRSVPVAPGIPGSAVDNMIVLDYGTPASLQWVRENIDDLAAVVVEPVQSRHPSLQPFEFLREIRRITEEAGVCFVMDEVVTGFRTHPGGIQALAGVRADLATYGKVVGGGLPIGILAGKASFMDALDGGQWSYGDDSFPEVGVTFFAGTFVRHPLVMAAAWAVLQHIEQQGPALQQGVAERTTKLAATLNELFAEFGVSARAETFSSWFYFHLHNEHPLAGLLFHHLRLRGIHIHDGFPCFLTTAHSQADIQRIVDAFRESLTELRSVGIVGTAAGTSAVPSPAAAATPAAAPQTGIPLTESQTEIWLSAQMGDEASCAFNESVTLRLTGQLDEKALRAALTQVIARHDALRATFSRTGEEMRVQPPAAAELQTIDLSADGTENGEQALEAMIAAEARTPLDLVNGPTVRYRLARLAPQHHALIVTAHHIICDGWSFNVIVNELAEIYTALRRGAAASLQAPLAFSAYARAQAQHDPAEAQATETYWLQQFEEPVRPLDLPTDRPRGGAKSYAGASRCRRIDAKLYKAVKQSGAKVGNTLFVTLLGAFQVLIGRLCDQDEVVVGVPTAGQSLLEDQILVGHCVNFLPIRARWARDTSMAQHLASVAKRVLDAYEHQSYTLGTLVRKLDLAREQNRVPLAEIQFNLERLADRLRLPDLEVEVAPNPKAHVNFDLFLNVIESDDGLRLDCDYNTDLLDAATIDTWLDCYEALLTAIVADASRPVVLMPYLPVAIRQQVLADRNRTDAQLPAECCVHRLFEARAAQSPRAITAQFGSETLSYEELDRRANRLAAYLLRRMGGTGAERLVGIAVERSLDMLVAMIAVLKAGCAYVPLDPTHPPARLRYILEDAHVAALITDQVAADIGISDATPVIHLTRDAAAVAASTAAAPAAATSGDSLAYAIYTSGSTGRPKGVEVSHRAVVNLLMAMSRSPGLTAKDVFFAVTTVSFDIAGLELFLPLMVGARVVIADRDELADGFELLRRIQETGATAMQATPATWRLLLEAGFRAPAGFRMLCGGEALPRDLADRLLAHDGELWNMYGPTETTIWSSCSRIHADGRPITVGGPIANTQFYVLDRNDQPSAPGVPGQLHIGGMGLARGYHERPELTAEKFLGNPFAPGRIYRTGDLARWLPDGTVQVLGRIDQQVKVRGFRIELGEIEASLTRKAGARAAAVILREDVPGRHRLVAYYVPGPGAPSSPDTLAERLAEDLPEYMIPDAWVQLEALPVSPNGKLDRAALPAPAAGQQISEQDYRAPTTATEIEIARICAEVLHLERVGVDTDLLRLGADSIQMFQIVARVNRIGLHLTAKQLLQQRTIAEVGKRLDAAGLEAPKRPAESSGSSLSQFKRSRRAGSKTP